MHKPMTLSFDDDGNIVVASPSPGAEVLVAKFTPAGELLWQRAVSMVSSADEERDSVSPLLIDGPASLIASRLASRRRGRLVAGSVVAACALTVGIAGFGVIGHPGAPTPAARSLRAPVTELASRAAPAIEMVPGATAVAEPPSATEAASDETTFPEVAIAPTEPTPIRTLVEPIARVEPVVVARTDVAASEPVAAATAIDDRAESLALLQRGDLAAAADRARAMVVSSPDDAFSYLVLGAALQDQGREGEARAVYYACAQNAWNGSVAECMALAGLDLAAEALASP
jgi:hypothetical protein